MSKISSEILHKLCKYGSLAPSVHNTQPWQFNIKDKSIYISVDPSRILNEGDPIGRQLWISIGACVETMVVAAQAMNFETEVKLTSEDSVCIKLKPSKKVTTNALPLNAIESRFTDRSPYKKVAITDEDQKLIQNSWKTGDTSVIVTSDKEVIRVVASLISKGISMALSSPGFRKELSELIVNPSQNSRVGISSQSLRLKGLKAYAEAILVKQGRGVGAHAKSELKLWEATSALALTFSKGDSLKYWLDAGRAYQRAGLTAASLGIRQATSAAIVEALDFHEDIEKIFGTNRRLQTVMRLGYSDALPAFSPRLDLKDLLVK